jgi:uncharacterized membrane protein
MTDDQKQFLKGEGLRLGGRLAWGLVVAVGVNALWFDGRNTGLEIGLMTALCVTYLLETLHRTWRHFRQASRRRESSVDSNRNGDWR